MEVGGRAAGEGGVSRQGTDIVLGSSSYISRISFCGGKECAAVTVTAFPRAWKRRKK